MIVRLSVVGAILACLAVLLVFASARPARERLMDYFEEVDSTDKTPVLLRYKFQPGQEMVFESTDEVFFTYIRAARAGEGVMCKRAKSTFRVTAVDGDGAAFMEVRISELDLETGAGLDGRRLEITADGVRAYQMGEEVEPGPEELAVRESVTQPFTIVVSPQGDVSFGSELLETQVQVAQIRQFVTTHLTRLPQDAVAAGDEWDAELPVIGDAPADAPRMQCKFLGYREYKGERCAVLRFDFSGEMELPSGREQGEEGGGEGAQGSGRARMTRVPPEVKFAAGLVFSLTRGLPLVAFRRQEAKSEAFQNGKRMLHVSSEEEYVAKLVSVSESHK